MTVQPPEGSPPAEPNRSIPLRSLTLSEGVRAYFELFGPELPGSHAELTEKIFMDGTARANAVSLALRQFGFEQFRNALHLSAPMPSSSTVLSPSP